jgi:hypothetical protein
LEQEKNLEAPKTPNRWSKRVITMIFIACLVAVGVSTAFLVKNFTDNEATISDDAPDGISVVKASKMQSQAGTPAQGAAQQAFEELDGPDFRYLVNILPKVTHADMESYLRFYNDHKVSTAKKPIKIVAVGDLHGNFDNFVHLLLANQIINQSLKWIAKDTILVQTGDNVDRGIKCYEIYELLLNLSI